jgi:hypothetical protein
MRSPDVGPPYTGLPGESAQRVEARRVERVQRRCPLRIVSHQFRDAAIGIGQQLLKPLRFDVVESTRVVVLCLERILGKVDERCTDADRQRRRTDDEQGGCGSRRMQRTFQNISLF